MGLERTALPTSWGRIGLEYLNLTIPRELIVRVARENPTWGSLRSRENELRILGLELGFVFLNEGADVICHLEQFLPLLLV